MLFQIIAPDGNDELKLYYCFAKAYPLAPNGTFALRTYECWFGWSPHVGMVDIMKPSTFELKMTIRDLLTVRIMLTKLQIVDLSQKGMAGSSNRTSRP